MLADSRPMICAVGRRRAAVAGVVAALAAVASLPFARPASAAPTSGGTKAVATKAVAPVVAAPVSPPAAICNSPLLVGPATAPAGATVVVAGDNSAVNFTRAGTTYWFAPGVHTVGSSSFGQVMTANNATYIGGPGAIVDGQHLNRLAFTTAAANVTVRYLTIRNFGVAAGNFNEGVVNHDSGTGWTVEYNTITANAGAGLMIGDSNTVRFNCLIANGQYGFSVYKAGGAVNLTLDQNEIALNDTDDWETRNTGCGCSGGGKFWALTGAVVTNNWVHDNKAAGLFVDTNNVGFQIEGNYIENNSSEGLVYEISYNARIANNTFRRNAIVKGQAFAARGDNFPIGAVYISESGGDARLYGGVYSTLEITGNSFVDNWGGVILWENADRFCNSPANTSSSYCTDGGAATLAKCVAGTIATAPYFSDCRWKTQNVSVHDNDLSVDHSAIGCVATAMCAQEGLLSNYGTFPTWSPYLARTVQDAITFSQNDHFANNHYTGDWRFLVYETGTFKSLVDFQASPYLQDLGSSQIGTTPIPPQTSALDTDTATLEGSVGRWVPWFSANVSRSTTQAHTGTGSLRVDITAPNGWGAQLSNAPGFATRAGGKTVSFWAIAGSGSGLGATLTVKWRNSAGVDLQTDTLAMASLTSTWTQSTANLTAPTATAYVNVTLSSSTGIAGNTVYLDDFSIADAAVTPPPPPPPPPPPSYGGALDTDTALLEGSAGHWVSWFSANVVRSTAQAHTGTGSLRVDITAPNGWGAQLNNAPGFATGAGGKTVSFWAMTGSGSGLGATLTVKWRNSAGADLQTNTVAVASLTSTWTQSTANLAAPTGTAYVNVTLSSSTGVAGNTVFFDDFSVVDNATVPPPPPPSGGALDPDTAGLESSIGRWVPWFSDNLSRSTAQAHSGTSSLRVDITAPSGWGAQLSNAPGFAATPGNKAVSFWGLAGSGTGLGATLTVTWRNSSGANLRSDTVIMPTLTATWSQAMIAVTAPTGTAFVNIALSSSTGVAGNTAYFDDLAVTDLTANTTPPSPGALDSDTATLEGSAGRWLSWFSANVSRSTLQAHTGTNSLRVDITAPFGWGVQLNNAPGFATTPGPRNISFWAMAGSGIGLGTTLTVTWRDAAGANIRTDTVIQPAPLVSTWTQAGAVVTAPPGTAYVSLSLSSSTGLAGNTVYLDDIVVS
ncbi:MAG: hypothetical protein QOK39_1052 [Acidimicrobiaceae bacterium]|nr:hypothetical protein [Acidimicrobiaceae bacterium]